MCDACSLTDVSANMADCTRLEFDLREADACYVRASVCRSRAMAISLWQVIDLRNVGEGAYVYEHVRACACVCLCACACVCACVRACVFVSSTGFLKI